MEEGSYEWKPIRRERFILRTRLNAGFGGGCLTISGGGGVQRVGKRKNDSPK